MVKMALSCLVRRTSRRVRGHPMRWQQPTSFLSTSRDELLPFREVMYEGVEIDCARLGHGLLDDAGAFSGALVRTVAALKTMRKGAVYLKVDMQQSHCIPIAATAGFQYHHAEGDAATLLLWLPEDVECKVPPFATHQVGVAGAIVKGDHLLVVRENSKVNYKHNWKLPGGLVNLNEDLSDAAVREVREETSLDTRFLKLLAFRNQHKVQWGRDDMYAVCRLELLDEAAEICVDTKELDDACWMPLTDFKAQNKNAMLDYVVDLLLHDHPGFTETVMSSTVPHRRDYKLYHPQ